MESIIHLIIPIAGMAMVFGIVYLGVTANNREKMAMIAAGMNPEDPKIKSHSRLRIALLMIAIPIGILVGNLIHTAFGLDAEPAAVVFSFLFGGLALTATYFIEQKNRLN